MNTPEKSRILASLQRHWPLMCVVIMVVVVYGRSISFDFVSWDDDQNVTQNPWFLDGTGLRFWREHFVGMFVPLVYSVWYGLFKIVTPPDPRLFHGFNVLIHAVNTGLVTALTYRLLPFDRRDGITAKMASLTAGVMFALHPLQVESVAWVTGLRDLLCCLMVLIATYLSLYQGYRSRREFMGFVVFALALLCKPSATVLPVALGIIMMAEDPGQWRLALQKFVPWLVIGLIAVLRTKDIQTEVISFAVPDLPLASRLLVAIDSYGFYLTKLFWPFALAVDYGRTPEKVVNALMFIKPVFLLMATTALMAASFRRLKRYEWALIAFALVALAPTSGIVRFAYQHVSTVADHYMYLPMVGIALFAACIIARLPGRWSFGLVALLALFWGTVSAMRIGIWRDDKTLFPAMLEANPDSYGANIGMLAVAMREGRYQDGLPYLREAERLEPTNVVTLLDKWLLYVKLGRYREVVDDMPGHMLTKDQILANPNSRSTIGGQYVVLAYALMQTGDFKKSFEIACLARFAYAAHADLPSFFPFLGQKLGLELPAEKWCD